MVQKQEFTCFFSVKWIGFATMACLAHEFVCLLLVVVYLLSASVLNCRMPDAEFILFREDVSRRSVFSYICF